MPLQRFASCCQKPFFYPTTEAALVEASLQVAVVQAGIVAGRRGSARQLLLAGIPAGHLAGALPPCATLCLTHSDTYTCSQTCESRGWGVSVSV